MSISGQRGKVYVIDHSCPVIDCITGTWTTPDGNAICWEDEITRFNVTDRVNLRKYGHDKSQGWEDNCAGTRGMDITVVCNSIKEANTGPGLLMHAGRVVWLMLYPTGTTCARIMKGYAMVESVAFEYDLETGNPISYTATLASKGPWVGVAENDKWGGEECPCSL